MSGLTQKKPGIAKSKADAPRKISFVNATNAALDDALTDDPTVFLLGEDIADPQDGGTYKATNGLSTKHGMHRVRSTPISEQAIAGAAVGAAIAGMRPVAEIMMMNFITLAMDQITNHAAKLRFMSGGKTNVPLTIRTATGAGANFGAQHSDMLEAWFAHTPGMKVVVPSTPADTYGLLLSCIFDDDPCLFIENGPLYFGGAKGDAPERGYRIPLSKAHVERAGSDVTVIGYGRPMADIRVIAEALGKEGIGVEVIDLRTISPWDEATVFASVAKTKRAVVVHEAVTKFGVGAEVAARINEELFGQLASPVVRIGAPFAPVPYATVLEQAWLGGTQKIEAGIRRSLKI
ncbi:alpha-ketoacid dehydrogenase subunit beta [Parasphingorhabdus sp.]|uniref:alpha-ketoacid dehydrogenase subunit beta n=1 Tax=Parasphingorhabdus sp. TaxID=2709688 RepID=UPI003A8D8DA3